MSGLPSLGARGEGWVAAQLVLALLVLRSASGRRAWGPAARRITRPLGVVVGVAGAWLAARGAHDLGGSLTPFPMPRTDARLVRSGIYREVRHPIYGGLLLVHVGLALVTASRASLALLPVTAAFVALKSRLEEERLDARFPAYAAYRRTTPSFLPVSR